MQRIVIKLGTGVLTGEGGKDLDRSLMQSIAEGVSALKRLPAEVIMVSSGAVAAGLDSMDFEERPEEVATLQACAAVGQSRLMSFYHELFAHHDLGTAQLLLTHQDIDSPESAARIRATISSLLQHGNLIPIINENDSVAVEELKFGDNDALASHVALLAEADLLIMLTTVDGLLDMSVEGAAHTLIDTVDDFSQVKSLIAEEKGRLSVGGMRTKLEAAQRATEGGIPTIIANGNNPAQLTELAMGRGRGTRFSTSKHS